jgi:hypothetical protein
MRRLIEEAFPLKKVSEDSKHEKSAGRKGHISTLHIWPARAPIILKCQYFRSLGRRDRQRSQDVIWWPGLTPQVGATDVDPTLEPKAEAKQAGAANPQAPEARPQALCLSSHAPA